MATVDPLLPYVRFYQDVVNTLGGVVASLDALDAETRAGLLPFGPGVGAFGASLPPQPSQRVSLAGLWQPLDPHGLTGLTDLYEVVGRFSFQGPRDENLGRVSALVGALRNEMVRQRGELAAVLALAAQGHDAAAAREKLEAHNNRAQQEALLARFEPEAARLREAAAALTEALGAVKRPDLTQLDAASEQYRQYVSAVGAVYARALTTLRAQLAALSEVAGCEVPPSWPERLPFASDLPEDLVAPPPPETEQLVEVRGEAEQAAQIELQLKASLDELGVQLRRVEGEIAALSAREAELVKDQATARLIVRWAHEQETLAIITREIEQVRNEGQGRTATIATLHAELARAQSLATETQTEATALAQGLPAKRAALEAHRKEEPALFGKDEWRSKLRALDDEVEADEGALAQRQGAVAAARAELDRLRAREAQEQAQIAALVKKLDDARARESQTAAVLAEVDKALGAARPGRVVAPSEAEQALAMAGDQRSETRARIDRLNGEARRIREDADRATVQLRQVAGRREQAAQRMTVVERQSQQAVSQNLQRLAQRRQQGFEAYVAKVLGDLFESLRQVERVFVDPARQVMLLKAGAITEAPQQLRDTAERLAAFAKARAEALEGPFAAQEAVLARVSQTFVATAPEACRSAWDALA
ncbi:MAG: hypothetical protein JNK72_17505 [Myxococcales bacterium]|nr:hypothetical protein [Myxococcales bacterium]